MPHVVRGYFMIFLTDWVQADDQSTAYYKTLVVCLSLGYILLSYFESVMNYRITTGVAEHLHNKMLFQVSRAPLHFFDANPLGRIITRFSKDVAILDNRLPET